MSKKEAKDNAGRIADILRSYPDIVAGMEDYHSGEAVEFIDRVSNPANLYELDREAGNRIVDFMVEVADKPGLFLKVYKISHQRRLIVQAFFIAISELLECGNIEKAKELLKILIDSKNEDNNEDNGH